MLVSLTQFQYQNEPKKLIRQKIGFSARRNNLQANWTRKQYGKRAYSVARERIVYGVAYSLNDAESYSLDIWSVTNHKILSISSEVWLCVIVVVVGFTSFFVSIIHALLFTFGTKRFSLIIVSIIFFFGVREISFFPVSNNENGFDTGWRQFLSIFSKPNEIYRLGTEVIVYVCAKVEKKFTISLICSIYQQKKMDFFSLNSLSSSSLYVAVVCVSITPFAVRILSKSDKKARRRKELRIAQNLFKWHIFSDGVCGVRVSFLKRI